LTVPDSPANLTRFTRQAGTHGGTGYPQVRLLALVACGTRTLTGAVFGPISHGETTYAPDLLPSLRAGMIVLADRNFGAAGLLAGVAATGAGVLVRLKNGRRMPVLARYRDGSYLPALGALRVRVIDCQITVSTSAGRRAERYRLATTLLDHHRYPAAELVTLYHQRWEIETAYLELKSTMLGGRVLRARTPAGVTQEIYALLVIYQVLRTAMADATACGCRKPCHLMRPGNIHGSGRRAGPAAEPGRLRPERVDADARQAAPAAVPGAAGESCNDRRTRPGPAAGAVPR
jgi:hypothetical protein